MRVAEPAAAERVGWYRPPTGPVPDFARLSRDTIERLARITSVTSEVSDILDGMGFATAVDAGAVLHRLGPQTLVGHALTLAYLPEQDSSGSPAGRLAHHTAAAMAVHADVLVVSSPPRQDWSVLGGDGARALAAAGVSGAIVDGGIRDLDELVGSGLAVWSRAFGPRRGVGRLEASAINSPICCGGVQVRPGDLVVADVSGVVFIPVAAVSKVVAQLLG